MSEFAAIAGNFRRLDLDDIGRQPGHDVPFSPQPATAARPEKPARQEMIVERAGKTTVLADDVRGALRGALTLALGACTPRIEPAGPFLSPPQLKGDRIVAADGAVLPLRRWGSRPGRRAPSSWRSTGSTTIPAPSNDQENTGRKSASPPMRTISAGSAKRRTAASGPVTRPWRRMSPSPSILSGRVHPRIPAYVLGESMGGTIAMIAAPTLQADGLILAAPALRGRRQLGLVARAVLWLTTPDHPLVSAHRRGTERAGFRQRQDAARARP